MKKPYIVVVHYPDGSHPNKINESAIVLGGRVSDATATGAAFLMNQFENHGRVEAWWAAPPIYWQKELARTLIVGIAAGAILASVLFYIF